MEELGLIRELQQVADDAGGIEPQRLLNGPGHELAEQVARKLRPVDVRDVRAEHERGLLRPLEALQVWRFGG